MIDQATGEFLLVATIRLAMVCYFARLFVAGCRVIGRVPTRWQVVLWTLGCTLYTVHVLCAFAFAHQWSHAVAWEYTAQETQRLFGVRRGEGLWVNYLFTTVWGVDVVRQMIALVRRKATHPAIDVAIQLFMAFIVFNATAVFGPSVYRYAAVPVGILLAISYHWQKQSRT
ncbi:hypothetical protein [Planctomycetes bacterium K23_9]|uniref:Uncharacterized protein n=1 Tax=Stieleria marina TaxID=1930275 RepID=A0A517NMV1_9BACT|nr:hypothetical protein K239x_03680 [Planctomycetes bacterium K23_9]